MEHPLTHDMIASVREALWLAVKDYPELYNTDAAFTAKVDDEVRICYASLSAQERTKNCYDVSKTHVENWSGNYVSHTDLVTAAMVLGLTVEDNGYRLNISSRRVLPDRQRLVGINSVAYYPNRSPQEVLRAE